MGKGQRDIVRKAAPTDFEKQNLNVGAVHFSIIHSMIKHLIILSTLIFTPLVYASDFSFDDATRDVINGIMQDIYDEVEKAQGSYPELSGFDTASLMKDQNGLSSLSYSYTDPEIKTRTNVFSFTVRAIPAPQKILKNDEEKQDSYYFPVLGLKIQSLSRKNPRWHLYRIDKVIEKSLRPLELHQQNYLPLQMTLTSPKSVLKLNENIPFEISIKNISGQTLQVKKLNYQSLYCSIGNISWGTPPKNSSPFRDIRLRPNDNLTASFTGGGFDEVGEAEIICTYNLSHKGILPFAVLRVRIEE